MAPSTSSNQVDQVDEASSWAYGQPVSMHQDNQKRSTKQSSRGFFSRFRPTTSSWHTARRTGHTGASGTVASGEPFAYPDEETTQAGRQTQIIPGGILAGFTQKLQHLKDKIDRRRAGHERRKKLRKKGREVLALHTDFWQR